MLNLNKKELTKLCEISHEIFLIMLRISDKSANDILLNNKKLLDKCIISYTDSYNDHYSIYYQLRDKIFPNGLSQFKFLILELNDIDLNTIIDFYDLNSWHVIESIYIKQILYKLEKLQYISYVDKKKYTFVLNKHISLNLKVSDLMNKNKYTKLLRAVKLQKLDI